MTDSTDALEPRLTLDDPETFEVILGLVAEGEKSLGDIAKILQVPARKLRAFVASDEKRKDAYDRAVQLGEQADKERVLQTLKDIAFLDIKDTLDAYGRPLPVAMLPKHARMAVQTISMSELKRKPGKKNERDEEQPGTGMFHTSYSFYDRLNAIKLLGLEYRMFVEKHEHAFNPYQSVPIQVTSRHADPDKLPAPAIEAEFIEVSPSILR